MRRSTTSNSNGHLSDLQARVAKAEAKGQLNNTRRQLLRAILDNAEETYFLSSRELAKRYDMDAATVVRTVQALDYKRFADFAADLRKHFVTRITPYSVLKTATQQRRTPADHVINSLEKDLQNLTQLRSQLNIGEVLQAARRIRDARRVLIVGLDFAASLARSLDYLFTVLGIPSDAPVGTSGNLLHKVRMLNSKDLLITISFGRCLRDTVNAAALAKSLGIPTLGITDSELSPIARHCDAALLAPVANPSLAASYAAAMALVSAIAIASAHITPKRSLDVLRQVSLNDYEDERWYEQDARRATKPRENGNTPESQ